MKSNGGGTILVVDDDVTNIEVLNAALGETWEVLFATSGPQAMEIARATTPDLILLDVMMPEMDGYELFALLQAGSETANIPVIFVTGRGDLDAEVRGLEMGAVDYVTKPISPATVRLRVRNQIELKQAREQIAELAETDALTGVANRRRFDRMFDLEFRRLYRTGAPLSLILLDVDHFKLFNDHYGHVTGDDCLRKVAGAVDGVVSRAADLVFRYGGEEFGAVLPDTVFSGAVLIAERIRDAIAAIQVPHAASPTAEYLTASLGVASVNCRNFASPEEVIALADEQLYRAKSEGRNRFAAMDRTESHVSV
jgi:diguanylate cyclase (GGDEF)-like protein